MFTSRQPNTGQNYNMKTCIKFLENVVCLKIWQRNQQIKFSLIKRIRSYQI